MEKIKIKRTEEVRIKNYAYYKTPAKTARVNNLNQAGLSGKSLFDFSLLDEMELSEQDKEMIKEESFIDDDLIACNGESYYCKKYSDIEFCTGNTYFTVYKIKNAKTGKYLYRVYQLVGVDHLSQERANTDSKYRKTPCKSGKFHGTRLEIDI